MFKSCIISCITVLSFFFSYQTLLPHFLLLKTETISIQTPDIEEKDIENAKKILERPLTFLGLGSQCFAFESEDGEYVVKVCKATRYKPLLGPEKEIKRQADFLSYFLAFQELPDQSQITFLHLHTTQNLNITAKLIDPFGISHFLNADHLAFYIQKKATPLSEYLHSCNPQNSTILLKALIDLFKTSCQKGLEIRDIHPKNIGIYKGIPIWIDPGRIRKKTSLKNREVQKQKLRQFCLYLTPFLNSINPNLALELEKELENSF